MKEISSKFDPKPTEKKWIAYWQEKGFFRSVPDNREAYTIVIPPPNVTGVLHMGHMLNNTIQDILIRKARMQGKNACWVPGTDHASIATEAKVVAKLKEQGIRKWDISRDEFLEHAWEWTHKHGGIILEQLKRLGASCDWERETFTMDEARYQSVIQVFNDLYAKGFIYRGYRMVNWDPEAKTSVSDEEVVHKDVNQQLYYVNYPLEDGSGHIQIATTRPETILGDTAICVNPEDERYQSIIGKKVRIPLSNRSIEIIADAYVDKEFGTGCLKVTPAHDINDYEIGLRHNLEIIDVLNEDGTLNEHGLHYQGQDRFVVRKKIAKELDEKGFLVKTESYSSSVGTSERTGAVIEPRLSVQWFLKMKELSQPALKAVEDNEIQLVPEKFKNTYRHWMENVRDWCISRQLYWGHRIPAWYFGDDNSQFVVAMNEEEALEKARNLSGNANLQASDIKQDEDVLDTWFSSWLWPLSVFDGIRNPNNEEINYYYPTAVLVTAPEILFFWVARMIIAGYDYRNIKPFSTVYLHGIVRDKQGRKMSKSLGNSPDPLDLIEQYGADGIRMGMLMSAPAGNDILFDESLCEQGRNFANKMWNAMRLIKGWPVDESLKQHETARLANAWFEQKFNTTLVQINDLFDKFRLSEALMTVYKLVWDDYCAWYLEMIKPAYQQAIDSTTLAQSIQHFEQLLCLVHPFMPFVSEEIWQHLQNRTELDCLCVNKWPNVNSSETTLITSFDEAKEVISAMRMFRQSKQISPKEAMPLLVSKSASNNTLWNSVVEKLANCSSIELCDSKPEGAYSFVAGKNEYHISAAGNVDVEAERKRLQEEINYLKGFLNSVEKKLSNEKFVAGAPAQVIENERKKQSDTLAKLESLQASLNAL